MIFFETAGQARAFLLLTYAGFAAAVLYDAAGLLRRASPAWLRPVWDILWCLITGLCCALALALGGQSEARLYALLGLTCGAGVYALGARAALLALRRGISRIVKRRGE